MELLTVFLSSSVIAGSVSAIVSFYVSERRVYIENVTQERAKWRSSIRTLAESIVKSAHSDDFHMVDILSSQLMLNLDPFDSEDILLIHCVDQLATSEDKRVQIKEFRERVALLLKHDWERSKAEARLWPLSKVKPRVSHNNYKNECMSKESVDKSEKRSLKLFIYFLGLMFSAGVLFVLTVGLSEPFQALVKIFNDSNIDHTMKGWMEFIFVSVFCGIMWSAVYLCFKGSEKRFLEILFAK
ncbi:hypothetical protein [uncultured Rheinheimera sp.]|uniref:hypothetical protein n=1 Tax=uncultured Rheinheimera sp. TaxID=400532 RepID=UPI0025936853|nr:hypothetical protein [uncultured Rheinheimera sp.]